MKHQESCAWKNAVTFKPDQLAEFSEWVQKYLKENYKRMMKECKCEAVHKSGVRDE